jgi:hypothetical protein
MKRIFLSFSFRPDDRQVNNKVIRLVQSHNLNTVTGERAGGQPLRDRIFEQIAGSDALVAVLTRRDQLANTGDGVFFTTSEWVKNELNHGRTNSLKTIALVEEGVKMEGAFTDHEWLPFTRTNMEDGLLKLSETLGLWQREAGRTLKIMIVSPELMQNPRFIRSQMVIEYQFLVAGAPAGWQRGRLIREAGSAMIFVKGVQDNYLIQIRVTDGPDQWESDFGSQTVPILLRRIAGGGV